MGCLCRLVPSVPMVEPAQPRHRDHLRIHSRPLFHLPLVRRVLPQRVVKAILMMVVGVVSHDATQMLLVQRNHLIQDFAAATSDPPLGQPVLPGRPHARPLHLVRSKYSKVLKRWVISSRAERLWDNVTRVGGELQNRPEFWEFLRFDTMPACSTSSSFSFIRSSPSSGS